nr:MAG TPA: hypothetical protein [Caudoviricetes sp.]
MHLANYLAIIKTVAREATRSLTIRRQKGGI